MITYKFCQQTYYLLISICLFAPFISHAKESCEVSGGYNVYKSLNDANSQRVYRSAGGTQDQAYRCEETGSEEYLRIEIHPGIWAYVSSKAYVQDEKSSSNIESARPDSLSFSDFALKPTSRSLTLRRGSPLYDKNGNPLTTARGVGLMSENVQVLINEDGSPVSLNTGLIAVKHQIYSPSSNSVLTSYRWVQPNAVTSFQHVFNGGKYNLGLTGQIDKDEVKKNEDGKVIPEPHQYLEIHRNLEAANILTGPDPNLPKVDNLNDGLEGGSVLTSTGNRSCEPDSKRCFLEVYYKKDGDLFTGWVDERETNTDPAYHNSSLIAADLETDNHNEVVGDSPSINSNSPYYRAFDPENRIQKQEFIKMLEENPIPPQIDFATNRGLIRMHNSRRGFCGSYHYATEEDPTIGAYKEIQTYANPTSACVIARLMQTWKESFCRDGGACRLTTGDISHRTRTKFDGHETHTHGECIDLRPIRKYGSSPLDFNNSAYDQDKTRELLKLLKSLGGTNILFNDPVLRGEGLSGRAGGHDNHIHVCFKDENRKVKNSCSQFDPNYNTCPMLRSFFDNELMNGFNK